VAVVVIFALEREAKPFRKIAKDVSIIVSGVGSENARRAMEGVDASLVISAGFCGALNPELKVGDVIVSREASRLTTVPHLIATSHEKRELRERTSADIVDMEAATLREICESRGIPFLAVKAVSDSASTELSPRLVTLLDGGNISIGKAILAILRQPSILLEFLRLARDTRLAANNLADRLTELCGRPFPSPVA
jgi:adenosylhomocysteine nucleosidase